MNAVQSVFVARLPRLKKTISWVLRSMPDPEESQAEAIAFTWAAWMRLCSRRGVERAECSLTALAEYAATNVRRGRLFCGVARQCVRGEMVSLPFDPASGADPIGEVVARVDLDGFEGSIGCSFDRRIFREMRRGTVGIGSKLRANKRLVSQRRAVLANRVREYFAAV